MKKETRKAKNERLDDVLRRLEAYYGEAKPALHYQNPFQLLIAVMLSAQCTDKRVNVVTNELFQRYKTPEDIAVLSAEELEPMIRSCGLSKTKSKNMVNTCKMLIREYDGRVPDEIEILQTLPGVGRKTANVVASVAYGVPAIAVDTHVFRVSNRIGLADAKNVLETEKQLMERIPKEKWSQAHHWLIWHGRNFCTARAPKCDQCFLPDVCARRMNETEQGQTPHKKGAK